MPLLDRLRLYPDARLAFATLRAGQADQSIPILRRVVEIDPKFAMAYASLGVAYSSVGESMLSAESTTKAWRLRDRVSDRERFFIDFAYDRDVAGNLEKAYQTLELWYQTYPRGKNPNGGGLLGAAFPPVGQAVGKERSRWPKSGSPPNPALPLDTAILRPPISSPAVSPKRRALFSELPNASWRTPSSC